MFEAAFSANFANASAVPGFATGCPGGRGIAAFFDTFCLVNDVLFATEDVAGTVLFIGELAIGVGAEELVFDIFFPVTDAVVGTDIATVVVHAVELALSTGGAEYP